MISLVIAISLLGQTSLLAQVLFRYNFNDTNGLIVNEFAFWNPGNPAAHKSADWEMTSGSLFARFGAGWTGVPDDIGPNADSSNGNDSAVFRLTTVRSDFTNVAVSFALLHQGLTSTPTTPPVDWDGGHVFLRYLSESNLYYASFNRRDNTVVIKKKIPGGPSNDGTYYDLSSYVPHVVPTNVWQLITATVQNNQDGSVTIKLYSGGTLMVVAIDDGSVGGPPIRAGGKVGIRADNANLKFDNFVVTSLPPGAQLGTISAVTNLNATTPSQSSLAFQWSAFEDGPNEFYYAEAFAVSDTAAFSPVRLDGFGFISGQALHARISGLQPNTIYNVFLFRSRDLQTWSLASNVAIAQTSASSNVLTENFSGYLQNTCYPDGSAFGPWTNDFAGYGCIQALSDGVNTWLDEVPKVSTVTNETHACLVLGPSFSAPLSYSVSLNTVSQLRQGSQPNPWEVGWVFFNYQDDTHYYYFLVKTNGWELGKKDPAYENGTRFLATGTSPVFPIGNWRDLTIDENGQNAISVYVNEQTITNFTDFERPYTSGHIGLYCEDSHVEFRNVIVRMVDQ